MARQPLVGLLSLSLRGHSSSTTSEPGGTSMEWCVSRGAFSNRSSLEGCFIMRKGGTHVCVCEPPQAGRRCHGLTCGGGGGGSGVEQPLQRRLSRSMRRLVLLAETPLMASFSSWQVTRAHHHLWAKPRVARHWPLAGANEAGPHERFPQVRIVLAGGTEGAQPRKPACGCTLHIIAARHRRASGRPGASSADDKQSSQRQTQGNARLLRLQWASKLHLARPSAGVISGIFYPHYKTSNMVEAVTVTSVPHQACALVQGGFISPDPARSHASVVPCICSTPPTRSHKASAINFSLMSLESESPVRGREQRAGGGHADNSCVFRR
jgi:hypothetical protein